MYCVLAASIDDVCAHPGHGNVGEAEGDGGHGHAHAHALQKDQRRSIDFYAAIGVNPQELPGRHHDCGTSDSTEGKLPTCLAEAAFLRSLREKNKKGGLISDSDVNLWPSIFWEADSRG